MNRQGFKSFIKDFEGKAAFSCLKVKYSIKDKYNVYYLEN